MRGPVTASAAVAILAVALAGCRGQAPLLPRRDPPAKLLAVGLEQLSLRANAYIELHAWLAAAGRGVVSGPPGLEAAAEAYRRALADDDADELLAASTRALSSCTADRCAREALAGTAFARAFGGSLDTFAARWWTERAAVARAAIEIAQSDLADDTVVLVKRIAADLAIAWPTEPVAIDIVADAPPAGRKALVPVVLGARGTCFARAKGAEPSERVHRARRLDCILVHAVLTLRSRSALAVALERELGTADASRAWSAAAIHAVAATLTSWEPKHLSTTRRSALTVEPRAFEWLAANWRARAAGEGVEPFAARYAEAWRAATSPATRGP